MKPYICCFLACGLACLISGASEEKIGPLSGPILESPSAGPERPSAIAATPTIAPPSVDGITEPVTTPAAAQEVPAAGSLTPASPMMHLIRARGGLAASTAWAVQLDDSRLVTVAHLLDGYRGRQHWIELSSGDEQWESVASFTSNSRYRETSAGNDIAIVTANGLPPCEPLQHRKPKYGERVTVICGASDKSMCGSIYPQSGWFVALDAHEAGIMSGDSGSPVMSEDGELLGIVSAKWEDNRLIRVEPFVELLVNQGVQRAAAPVGVAAQPPSSGQPSTCVGPNCQVPRYQPLLPSRGPRITVRGGKWR